MINSTLTDSTKICEKSMFFFSVYLFKYFNITYLNKGGQKSVYIFSAEFTKKNISGVKNNPFVSICLKYFCIRRLFFTLKNYIALLVTQIN